MDLNTVLFALFGGVAPSLIWLWFWLREDKKNPEPLPALTLAFIAGALSTLVAIAFEKGAQYLIGKSNIANTLLVTMLVWAAIEESLKFIFAYFSSLVKSYYDEPVDALIYMITVALGFAAMENTLFLLDPIAQNNLFESVLTGNMRFLGATLLHILASSVIGIALALSFRKSRKVKRYFVLSALLLATIVHFAFNYSISFMDIELMQTFVFVWVALLFLLLVFEKIKKMKF